VTGLPGGLTATANGTTLTISGTPTKPGHYLAEVSVRDSESPARWATATIPIVVRHASTQPVVTTPLALTTCVPAVATVGDEGYSGTVTVTGGRWPYQWGSVTGLPEGLTATANGTTLTISGTPTKPGRYLAEVSVSDGESPAKSATVSIPITIKQLVVTGAPLRITADVQAAAAVGDEGYSGTATVSGGQGPYTWNAVTGLPDGLTAYANGTTLTISGTPAKAGHFTAELSVSDGESPAQTATVSIPITIKPGTGPMPLKITANVPAAAAIGQQGYSGTATVSGGKGPYAWAAVTGLPDGLTATANGTTLTISGTPAKAGRFTATVSVGDGESPASTATTSVTITVATAPTTTGPTTTGPTTPGPTTTGPTTTGPTTTGPTTSTPTTSTPTAAPLTITTTALPAATWNADYSATVVSSESTGVHRWSVKGLPQGLTLTTSGAALSISGVPTPAAGAAGFPVTDTVAVTLTDGAKQATKTLSLQIEPPPLTLAGGALPAGASGASYSATVSATGGAGAYTWSAIGLPAGLAIDSATGKITGTAPAVKTATTYRVAVTVADGETPAQTATATFTIVVNPPAPTTSPTTPTTGPSTPTTGPTTPSTSPSTPTTSPSTPTASPSTPTTSPSAPTTSSSSTSTG
jgi:hypothetical protein